MSEDNVDALKKGLAEIWAALSSCSYGDISETMMTVSRAKAKCLALIDPGLLCMNDYEIERHFAEIKDTERITQELRLINMNRNGGHK